MQVLSLSIQHNAVSPHQSAAHCPHFFLRRVPTRGVVNIFRDKCIRLGAGRYRGPERAPWASKAGGQGDASPTNIFRFQHYARGRCMERIDFKVPPSPQLSEGGDDLGGPIPGLGGPMPGLRGPSKGFNILIIGLSDRLGGSLYCVRWFRTRFSHGILQQHKMTAGWSAYEALRRLRRGRGALRGGQRGGAAAPAAPGGGRGGACIGT